MKSPLSARIPFAFSLSLLLLVQLFWAGGCSSQTLTEAQESAKDQPIPYPDIKAYASWTFPEDLIVHTLHVNPAAEAASDDNAGTEAEPMATIHAAVLRAFDTGGVDEGVRIQVHPGVYRETVDIVNWDRDAPLLIEGIQRGETVLSGSDVFEAWTPVPGTDRVYVHDWTLKWGFEDNPWPGLMPMKDGTGFRRELLFVDGVPYRQVYHARDLTAKTYFIDEEAEQVLLNPGEIADLSERSVEISVRPEARYGAHSKLIRVQGSRNIGFRNLTLRHAATLPFNSGALQILGTQNLLVEDCTFQFNNGTGFALNRFQGVNPRNVTLRGLHADDNGTMGFGGGMSNGLIEDSTSNRNNWRGAELGATGWAPCGFKLSGLDGVLIRNLTANENHASGGWFDDHLTNVTLENFTAINNYRSGLSIEASDGPFLVKGAVLMGNSTGINMFDTVNVFIVESVILNHQTRGIRIAGSTPLSEEELLEFPEGWRRNRLSKRRSPRDITVIRSLIGHTEADSDSFVYDFGMRDHAFELADGTRTLEITLETLRLAGNTYALGRRESNTGFRDALNQPISLAEWQELTGQDQDADWNPEALREALHQALTETELYPAGFGEEPQPQSTENVDELEL